ncbi:MAG: MXAN_6640 family putative metalloprotease [bacterium]
MRSPGPGATAFAAAAQPQQTGGGGTQKLSSFERDTLFLQALAILSPHRIPAPYRSAGAGRVAPPKCATMLLAEIRRQVHEFTDEQQAVLASLFSRPQNLPLTHVSQSGWYRIHYTLQGLDGVSELDGNGDGVPDYVEQVAAAFDSSHTLEVERLNYRQPPDDLGVDGGEYDVYISALARGVYGFTTLENAIPSTPQNDVTSFIQIDNDFNNDHFTTGVPGARVTAAHELFHAIQFGYRDAIVSSEYFYYEVCSSWMEDVVYDDINDYYASVPGYLSRTDTPFNKYEPPTSFNYGAALWNHFLVEKYGDAGLVLRSWQLMQNEAAVLSAIDGSLRDVGSSFEAEFGEFALWNYFTGERADSVRYYSEGHNYTRVRLVVDQPVFVDTTVVDSTRTLSYKYYRFTTLDSATYLLTGQVEEPEMWRFAVIVQRPGGEDELQLIRVEQGLNLGSLPESTRIVVVPVSLKTLDGRDLTRFDDTFSTFRFRLMRVGVLAAEQGIADIYPNPFILNQHNHIRFEFKPVSTINLEVRILNANGRVVKRARLSDNTSTLTPVAFDWDGLDEQNQPVASGVYLVQLKQDHFIQFKKFAVIRK